jgi:hypothetical protein
MKETTWCEICKKEFPVGENLMVTWDWEGNVICKECAGDYNAD